MTDANITTEDSSSQNQILKIVHISGQLDESNIDEKIQEIYKLVEANPKNLNLIYDLSNLDYMNSKSIGYMTDLYGKITENGGQVAIAKAKPNILDILQVVGLTQLIKSFDSIEEAKKMFTPSIAAATTPTAPMVQSATPTPAAPDQVAPTVQPAAPVAPPITITPASPATPVTPPTPTTPTAPLTPAIPVPSTFTVTPTPPSTPAAAATPAIPAPTPNQ